MMNIIDFSANNFKPFNLTFFLKIILFYLFLFSRSGGKNVVKSRALCIEEGK